MRGFLFALTVVAAVSAQVTLSTIRNAAANTWIQVPNTPLRAVAPSASQYPNIQAVEGVSAVIDDWCGGVFDTQRNQLVIWGGGHNGYFGNELYAFLVDSLKWKRLTNPTPNPVTCADNNPDGTPNSRHTYHGLAYISHADRFFGIGGALACPPGSCGAPKTWTFNFVTSQWTNRAPTGTIPGTCCDDCCAYDPITRKVFFGDAGAWSCGSGRWGLYVYDYDLNTWTKLNSLFYIGAMAVDTKRHVLLNVGHTSASSSDYVTAFDLSLANPPRQVWNTTGGAGFITLGGVGLEYDPVADKYVGWHGGAVYELNPDTKAWTAHTASGGPPSNVYGVTNGVYGRWRYVPSVNAYITVVSVDGNVYFYKLTAGTGVEQSKFPDYQGSLVEVSPNPVTDRALIRTSGKALIRIFDLRGKMVHEVFSAGSAYEWNATAMPCGIYTVRVVESGRVSSARLFLQK